MGAVDGVGDAMILEGLAVPTPVADPSTRDAATRATPPKRHPGSVQPSGGAAGGCPRRWPIAKSLPWAGGLDFRFHSDMRRYGAAAAPGRYAAECRGHGCVAVRPRRRLGRECYEPLDDVGEFDRLSEAVKREHRPATKQRLDGGRVPYGYASFPPTRRTMRRPQLKFLRFTRTYEWTCEAPSCARTIRSRDRLDFKVEVMSHRKFHIITDPDSQFEQVWDDDLWGDGSDGPPA